MGRASALQRVSVLGWGERGGRGGERGRGGGGWQSPLMDNAPKLREGGSQTNKKLQIQIFASESAFSLVSALRPRPVALLLRSFGKPFTELAGAQP